MSPIKEPSYTGDPFKRLHINVTHYREFKNSKPLKRLHTQDTH